MMIADKFFVIRKCSFPTETHLHMKTDEMRKITWDSDLSMEGVATLLRLLTIDHILENGAKLSEEAFQETRSYKKTLNELEENGYIFRCTCDDLKYLFVFDMKTSLEDRKKEAEKIFNQ